MTNELSLRTSSTKDFFPLGGPITSNFARYRSEGNFEDLRKGILERGESHASRPIINRDSKCSSNESVVDDGKNRRLDGAGLWLLAYGDEPTVFAPWRVES